MVIATLFRRAVAAANRFAQRRIRRNLPAAPGTTFGTDPIETAHVARGSRKKSLNSPQKLLRIY
jgi:hypothetical protein